MKSSRQLIFAGTLGMSAWKCRVKFPGKFRTGTVSAPSGESVVSNTGGIGVLRRSYGGGQRWGRATVDSGKGVESLA